MRAAQAARAARAALAARCTRCCIRLRFADDGKMDLAAASGRTRHLGFPKGQWVFPTERDCKAQGLEGAGAKARSRSQEHERKTKRARPGGRDQEAKSRKPRASMSGPPTERGCKAQGLEGARALRPWGSDGSKARGHGRSPCYRSSVFRRKGRSPS